MQLRMSGHIITKSEQNLKQLYVDAAAIQRRLFILPGEIFLFFKTKKKSAEVIVVVGNEPLERTEVSQNSEGLNVGGFQFNKEVQI